MNCRVRWAVFEYGSPVMIPLLVSFFFPLCYFFGIDVGSLVKMCYLAGPVP